ncbi:chemotaxis protein CheW [Novipirellula artificiosorum]|uniref:Chemotaxis protein CheW n=1 Tax=Novipirellula artificiosorum TaxID=2528016 RepID=A0A5C6DBS7_9BACT|nr:chemotaxis protein CheW [Novipirellula artificiosorum]TWU33304.1 Chemotaxis protein CheW [Novipirellula artificiosorum]
MVDQSASDSASADAIPAAKNTSQFVGFQIDSQQYAFRIDQIQEIVMLDQVTKTPQVADYVEGVRNLRGAIIPIINLRRLLGLAPIPADNNTRTIVVNVGDRTIGCTVDSVTQVIRIPEQSIQPAPDTMTAEGNRDIAGFAKMGDNLVIIMNIDELLNLARLRRHPNHEMTTAKNAI